MDSKDKQIRELEEQLDLREKRIEELYGWWEEAEKREAALREVLDKAENDYEQGWNEAVGACIEAAYRAYTSGVSMEPSMDAIRRLRIEEGE